MIRKINRPTIVILLASLAVFPAAAVGMQTSTTPSTGQQPTQPAPKPVKAKIKYSIVQLDKTTFSTGALVATLNGKRQVLVSKSKNKCLQIIDERDFDGDGSLDALVEDVTACGGNCCSNQFFFASALPDGTFAVSDEFADSWKDPVIEKWKGRWSVVVVSNNEGVNTDRPVEFTRRFVLEAGKAVKVEEHQRKDMNSILEMRSEIFHSQNERETHTLKYDLDGDGKKDTITGHLWERWGRIMWTVEFADGKKFSSNDACKRIGVLATKTNGVHDLVCDQDTVLHWNGSEYK
ncbi:MAG TPA: hypothetical protein VI636_24805 [Candidatus Angelobacter sp.]